MCCDTTMCGAQSETCRFASCAPRVTSWRVDTTSQLGQSSRSGPARCVHDAAATALTVVSKVNPVRQCARRGVVGRGVAQASPLFSDHAPREVHLWQ